MNSPTRSFLPITYFYGMRIPTLLLTLLCTCGLAPLAGQNLADSIRIILEEGIAAGAFPGTQVLALSLFFAAGMVLLWRFKLPE